MLSRKMEFVRSLDFWILYKTNVLGWPKIQFDWDRFRSEHQ